MSEAQIRDPYEVLGVSRKASAAEIRAAFRKLAKEHHPDLHPNEPEIEARFKEISAAYDLLSDPEKRGRYDRDEIDASGAERPERRFYRGFAEGPEGAKYRSYESFENAEDMEEFLSAIFGGRGGARGFRTADIRGSDVNYVLDLGFLETARGTTRRLTTPDGKTLDVTIPAGTKDGDILRLAGQGTKGFGRGAAGDAYVQIRVAPHPLFTRKDNNIHMELPVTLKEAVLGAKIDVPTISGKVSLTIPKGSNTGTTLRLKGKGLTDRRTRQVGDQYVALKVMLPKTRDPELEKFLAGWQPAEDDDPRKGMTS